MAININGIIAIKMVNKKIEQGQFGMKTIFTGTCISKEEFSAGVTEMDFKMEAREKQVQFLENYLMAAGKSGFMTGTLVQGPNGLALNIKSFEFGSIKMDQGSSNGGNKSYNNNNNGGYNNNNGGGYSQSQSQQQPKPSFSAPTNNNPFNNNQNQHPVQQNDGVAGVTIPETNNNNGGSIWKNFQK